MLSEIAKNYGGLVSFLPLLRAAGGPATRAALLGAISIRPDLLPAGYTVIFDRVWKWDGIGWGRQPVL